jgi:hypothetical protein
MYPGCDLPEQDYLPDRPAPLSSLDVLQGRFRAVGHRAGLGWDFGPQLGRFQETPSAETCSRWGSSLTGESGNGSVVGKRKACCLCVMGLLRGLVLRAGVVVNGW